MGRKERSPGPGPGPDPPVVCGPGLSWEMGDVWALEGMAQGVAFHDTLGGFPDWIGRAGGERERQKGSVPLLDLSPPPASKLHGSNPPLLPAHAAEGSPSPKLLKTKMHSILLKTKQMNNRVLLDR